MNNFIEILLKYKLTALILISINFSCVEYKPSYNENFLTVLGIAQDAGYPHIGCNKDCCNKNIGDNKYYVTSIGLTDIENDKNYLFEATPDIGEQIKYLKVSRENNKLIDGIFLTHAHIGHYSGLMYLGREALGAKNVPIYTMPRMKYFLQQNGPWSQLVSLENIKLEEINHNQNIRLSSDLKVIPFNVPHRDEFSETVGYKIIGKNKSALFIPDIDKWDLWDKSIVDEVKSVDYAFLDATFFSGEEINRSMSEIPHPFISETINLFKDELLEIKNKIYFIHFNHTNPVLNNKLHLKDSILKLGFNFAKFGNKYDL